MQADTWGGKVSEKGKGKESKEERQEGKETE